MKKSCYGGGPLLVVMLSLFVAGVITLSVTSLISFQRKMGVRQQLKLHSMAAAEAAIDYAFGYISNDANLNGLDQSSYLPPYGATAKAFTFPEDALKFLKNQNTSSLGKGSDAISFSDIKVTALPRPKTQTRVYISPDDKTNANRGQWVYQETITLVSAVTASQGGITQTSYARKDINYNITNLFQHAIFFQGQLHLHRGFKVMGSVHTNGNLILNAHGGDRAIYNGFVAAGNRFYRGSCITGDQTGNKGTNAFGLVPELANGDLDPDKFKTVPTGSGDGTTYTPKDGDIPIYIDTTSTGKFQYRFVNQSTDSRMSLSTWSTAMSDSKEGFNGHLQDKYYTTPVPIINPIGSNGYNMNTDGKANNSPYFLIEPLLPSDNDLRGDNTQKANYHNNLSANASLVLRVEYIARKANGDLIDIDPNEDKTYCPTSAYSVAAGTALPQSQNPANYIVRAYKKPSTLARANDPTERVAIPFPTDVIGRADYRRVENSGGYDYVASADSQPVDIIGTESGITTATAEMTETVAGRTSPARVIPSSNQVLEEAWHRYHIESYYPVATTALVAGYTTTPIQYVAGKAKTKTTPAVIEVKRVPVLPGVGTPLDPWGALQSNLLLSDGKTPTPTILPGAPAATATATTKTSYPLYGLHDSRLGRGAHLLTLDISRLKEIMEADINTVKARFGTEAYQFRLAFNNGSPEWNGIVCVEFPTTTTVLWENNETSTKLNHAPGSVTGSVKTAYYDNATKPQDSSYHSDTDKCYLDTFLFAYAQVQEKRYPLRTSDKPSPEYGRADQTVPIAKEFRTYPDTVDSISITDPANAVLALQVINAKRLPKVNTTKFDATASNTLKSGFTLATNAPLYLIGSWNSDGDYTTGTNVTSTDPTNYATTDSGTSTDATNLEIPSALFCDMLTVLSPAWATQTNYPDKPNALTRRQNSFPGWGSDSDTYRKVTFKQDAKGNTRERIEISACIATGDFPIFEFFPHALEEFKSTNGSDCTSLVVKGAMVSMFTSEVQHLKQAYNRDATKDIQVYWAAHGANSFPSPRFHQFIIDGNFPPGTPQALLPSQSNFQVIFKGAKAPEDFVEQAGF